MIQDYKHTYSTSASILILVPANIESMVNNYDLKTKAGRIAYVIAASGHVPGSIAKPLGCEPAAIYQWISGSTKNLKEHLLWNLADITGFEARWISMGEGPQRLDQSIKHATDVLTAMEPDARYTAVRLIDTLAEPTKRFNTQ